MVSDQLFLQLGILLLVVGFVFCILNVKYDPNIAYRLRDSAYWSLLVGAACITIAIYQTNITRNELQKRQHQTLISILNTLSITHQ